jgi:hypothetical protein
MRKLLLFYLLFCTAIKIYGGSRLDIKKIVIWENKQFTIINSFDLTDKKYDSFANLADSGKVFSSKNKYSRLYFIEKSNKDTLFDIPMIPSTLIEYKNGQICCLTQYVFSGVPQVTIVDIKGNIKAVQFLIPMCYFCDTTYFQQLKEGQEGANVVKLEGLNGVRFQGKYYQICIGAAIGILGENSIASLVDSINQHCELSDSTIPYNSVLTSSGRLLWYAEKTPRIRWRLSNKRKPRLLFRSYINKSSKLDLYLDYPGEKLNLNKPK